MKTIRSEYHQLSSYQINKVSLSCFDDKRHSLLDGISSYAYGYKGPPYYFLSWGKPPNPQWRPPYDFAI